MPLPIYLMSNFPSVRPSLNLQFDSQPTPEDMTSHLASVGATFSRASIGTYTDANGLIQEASAGQARPNYSSAGVHEGLLIEESRTNILKSSEDFSTTDWNKARSFIIVNQAIAPDGTASADKLVESTDTNSHLIYQDVTYTSGVKYTQTVFLKKAEQNFATLFFASSQGFNANYGLGINLTTGETTATSGLEYSVEDVGNGWFKCSITETTNATSGRSAYIVVQKTLTDALVSYAGNGTSGIYIWGAQLEEGSFPTSYIPTIPTFSSRASTATYFDSSGVLQTQAIQTSPTGVGRIDHKYIDGQWVEAGLLLEAEGINRITNSEQFENWNHPNITVTTNATTAPDGTTTADLLDGEGTPTANRVTKPYTHSTSGVDFTFSVFIKANELDRGGILIYDGSTFASATFDLTAETITKGSGKNVGIENVGNGWYRLYVSGTNTSTSNVTSMIYLEDLASSTTVPSGDGFYVWGAQLEKDTLQPSSYIKTTTAEVTRSEDVYTTQTKERSADVCYIDGTAFTDFYNDDAGTVFTQFESTASIFDPFLFMISDGTSTNRIAIDINDGTEFRARITDGGSTNMNGTYSYSDAEYKLAFKFSTSGSVVIDGTERISDGSTTLPTVDRIHLNSQLGSNVLTSTIKKFIYFPRALSDNELIKLTQ